jgi:hypothetical protein
MTLTLIVALVALVALAFVLVPTRPLRASPMLFERTQHSATRLSDGRVLVAGGGQATAAEIYDPATDRWSLADAMRAPRQGHAAILLPSGRVLVVGGASDSQLVEIYDPVTDRWSQAAPLHIPRGPVAATLLNDGRIIVVGGNATDAATEIYDPAANSWTLGSPAPIGSYFTYSTAITLRDGRVMFAGGYPGYISTITLYNPAMDRWALIRLEGYAAAQAAPLADGRVLIIGLQRSRAVSTALIFDPADDTVRPGAELPCLLQATVLTLLRDGRALAFGETYGQPVCNALYDPASGRWIKARAPASPRYSFTATELDAGIVLLAGGVNAAYPSPGVGSESERYDVATAALDELLFLPSLQQDFVPTLPGGPTVTPAEPTPTAP